MKININSFNNNQINNNKNINKYLIILNNKINNINNLIYYNTNSLICNIRLNLKLIQNKNNTVKIKYQLNKYKQIINIIIIINYYK